METRRRKLSEDRPDMLGSTANLALTYKTQGRWKEAQQLQLPGMETRSRKLVEDHPDMLANS
jgi:hypothetical protein